MRNRDWLQADQSFRKALALAPASYESNPYNGAFRATVGQPSEAIAYFRQAARTEPLLLIPVLQLGMAHELNSEFDLALAEFERAEGLIGNESFRQLFIAVVAMELGDRALIEDALNKVLDAGDLPANINKVNSTMLSLMDQPEAARMELHRFAGDPGFNLPVLRAGIAVWSSYVGDRELALRIYRDLYVGGELDIFAIWRPIEKDMRRLPGFKETLRDIGLVDYWRSTGNWNDFCRRVGHSDCGCE